MIDFSKIGKNTRVWSFQWGWGTANYYDAGSNYPVDVIFDSGRRDAFTACGKWHKDAINQCLFFNEFQVPKEAFVQPLAVDTLILVRDYDSDRWKKRYFAKMDGNKVRVFLNGATSKSSDNGDTVPWAQWKFPDE